MTHLKSHAIKTAAVALLTTIIASGTLFASIPAPQPRPEKKEPEPALDNPIRKVSDMMKEAAQLLEKLKTDTPTQEQQKKILSELDVLIEMAQQQSSSSPSPGQQKKAGAEQEKQPPSPKPTPGTSPAPSESDILRPVGVHPSGTEPNLVNLWGKLPDAPRDDIMQLLNNEELPMKYRRLLYFYLKALSEKK